MDHLLKQSLALAFSAILALGSIGALVAVPPVQVQASAALALPELA